MQSDDIFTVSDVNDLFLVEGDGWKYADLFTVEVNELMLKGDGKFLFDGLLEIFDFGFLGEFNFEGFGLRWFEVDFNGLRIFGWSGFLGVLNVSEEVFVRLDGSVMQTVLVLRLVGEKLLELFHFLFGWYFDWWKV